MQEEGIDIEGIDSDGMDEDEEALLEAMDAEDAAAELDSSEMLIGGESTTVEGKMGLKEQPLWKLICHNSSCISRNQIIIRI